MKTYLLREPKTVEPQTPARPGGGSEPAVTAVVNVICGPPPATVSGRSLFIGLDVHTDSIAVSLAPSDSPEVRRYGLIGGTHDDVLRLAKKLQAAHPGVTLKFCYEAGPHGYPLGGRRATGGLGRTGVEVSGRVCLSHGVQRGEDRGR
jgi:hypothetical protein